MNATLSTTAWVLHDLGLATSLGGTVFGKAGLRPATDPMQTNGRSELISEAWKKFTPINLLSHLSVGVTWLIGRSILSGREVKRSTRKLVVVKDALTGVYLVSGLAASATGYCSSQLRDGKSSTVASMIERTPLRGQSPSEVSRKLERVTGALGTANVVAGAALLGLTAVLAMQAGKSTKWSLVSRFLP